MIELQKKVKEKILTRSKGKKQKKFLLKKVFIPIAICFSIYGVANNYVEKKIEQTVSSSDYNNFIKYNSGSYLYSQMNELYNRAYSDDDFKQDLEIKNEFDETVKQEFTELNKQFKLNNGGEELFNGNVDTFYQSFKNSNLYAYSLLNFYRYKQVGSNKLKNKNWLFFQKASYPNIILFVYNSKNSFLRKIFEENAKISDDIFKKSIDPLNMQTNNIISFLTKNYDFDSKNKDFKNDNYYMLEPVYASLETYSEEYDEGNNKKQDKIEYIKKEMDSLKTNIDSQKGRLQVDNFITQQLEKLKENKKLSPYTLNDDNIKSSLRFLRISTEITNNYRDNIYSIIDKNEKNFSHTNKTVIKNLSNLNLLRFIISYSLDFNKKDNSNSDSITWVGNKYYNNHYNTNTNEKDKEISIKTLLSGVNDYNSNTIDKNFLGFNNISSYYITLQK